MTMKARRILVQEKHNRICPCCGKNLKLIPPTKDLLPERFGVSSNGVDYYLYSNPRIISYTKRPKSNYKGGTTNSTLLSEIEKNTIYRRGYQLVTVHNTRLKLHKDGKSLFSSEMVFFCDYCKAKLALNSNPFAIRDFQIYQTIYIVYFLMMVLPLISNARVSLWFYVITFALFCLQFISECICISISYKRIRKFTSNFVPTDEFDNLIIPTIQMVTTRSQVNERYIHKSNVYKVNVGGNDFFLYLVDENENLFFHICGIDGEPQFLFSLLSQDINIGNSIIIPILFEDKYIGKIQLIDMHNIKN